MFLPLEFSGGGRGGEAPGGPAPARLSSWYARLKGPADFAAACCLLVPAAPLLLLSALLVKLTSRGPVFYAQTRLGRHGRPYRIYKVRTMYHECERQSGPRWSTAGDPRVTPVGRLLRRTHLDELPQLWNVLKGDMSLVGPRPERPEFIPALERCLPHYRQRLLVRPGVTGLAQVQLPADTDLESVRRKLAYDLYYVRKLSPWLDLRLLLGTALKVLGVSPPLLGMLFRMPSREAVEDDYRGWTGPREAVPQGEPEPLVSGWAESDRLVPRPGTACP
jgi:lipopolysaccharide/colanic/teichoic acid biosynthesis glycosyltransferase